MVDGLNMVSLAPVSFMAQYGERLIDNGFPIIPIKPGSKIPGYYSLGEWYAALDWQKHCERATKSFEYGIWKTWPNCGIGIAGGWIVGVDIDLLDEAVGHDVEKLARDMLGDTPVKRIGRAPKRLLVYRTDKPFRGLKRHPLEILAHGQQFLAFAIHPDTNAPYTYPEESLLEIDAGSLPDVTEHRIRQFVDEAVRIVPPHLMQKRLPGGDGGAVMSMAAKMPAELQGTYAAIEDALRFVHNDDLDYDSWIGIGHAIKGALGEAGLPLWEWWSSTSAKDEPDVTAAKWPTFKPQRKGAGSIYHVALLNGWSPAADIVLNPFNEFDGEHPAQGLIDQLRDTPIAQAPDTAAPPEPDHQAQPGAAPWLVKGGQTPAQVYELDGVLLDMWEYICHTAESPQPFLTLGACLAALGVIMGRKYRSPSDLRTNLYIVGVAKSGGGKDYPRKVVAELFVKAGLGGHLGGNKIASGQALFTTLYRQPCSLFNLDEFGHKLKLYMGRNASSHMAELWSNLTELFTSAGGTFRGAEYANQKEKPREDIQQPCCGINATTAPDIFWRALEGGALMDGSVARWLLFVSDCDFPDRRERDEIFEIPEHLIEGLKAVAAGALGHDKGGNLAGFGPAAAAPIPYTVPYEDDARPLISALKLEQTERLRQAPDDATSSVVARLFENTVKIALIRAVSFNPVNPVIRRIDIEWAQLLVEHCIAALLNQAERFVASNETEAKHKKVMHIIRSAADRGIDKSTLCRRTQYLTKRDREEILMGLIEARQIVADAVNTNGRRSTVYRALIETAA